VFTSAEGRFTVEAPVPLVEKSEDIALPNGRHVTARSFVGDTRDVEYVAGYMEIPLQGLANGPDALLHQIAAGETLGGRRVLRSEKISLDAHHGRAVDIETDAPAGNTITRVRMYLVGTRVYQVWTVQRADAPDAESARHFLDSFRLTSPGKN
jgi:hypothetical protein